jgi:hypothetical protein
MDFLAALGHDVEIRAKRTRKAARTDVGRHGGVSSKLLMDNDAAMLPIVSRRVDDKKVV